MNSGDAGGGDSQARRVIEFGSFRLDLVGHVLHRAGLVVHLPPRCLAVLEILALHPGELVLKEDLLEAVWEDVHVTEDALTQAVSRIRQALGDDPRAPRYVRTIPRRGYEFVADVHDVSDQAVPTVAAEPAAASSPAGVSSPGAVQGGGPTRQQQPLQRPAAFRSAATFSAAVVAGLLLGLLLAEPLLRSVPTNRLPRTPYEISLPLGWRVDGANIAISRSGEHLAFAATDGEARRLFLKAVTDLEPVPVVGSDGAENPFFSWEGDWLAYFRDSRLWRVPLDGGNPEVVATLSGDADGASGSWGPDGNIIYGSLSTGLWRVGSGGGDPEGVLSREAGPRGHGYVSPHHVAGGRTLLFTVLSEFAPAVWALDLADPSSFLRVLENVGSAWYGGGALVYQRERSLMAIDFDLESRQSFGSARLLQADVGREWLTGKAFAAISADGDIVFVPRDELLPRRSVFRLRRGEAPSRLTAIQPRGYTQVKVSPSGELLVLVTIDLDSTDVWTARVSHPNALRHIGMGAWATWARGHDDRLAIGRREPDAGIFEVSIDGDGPLRRLLEQDRPGIAVSWDPREEYVLFQGWRPGGYWDLATVDLTSGGAFRPRPFTARSRGGALAPDGRYVAYAAAGPGAEPSIFVEPFPDGGEPIPVASGSGVAPLWSPTGGEIFYVSGSRLVAVPIATEPTLSIAGPEEVIASGEYAYSSWSQAAYGVTPNGREVYLVGPDEASGARKIVVVLGGVTR